MGAPAFCQRFCFFFVRLAATVISVETDGKSVQLAGGREHEEAVVVRSEIIRADQLKAGLPAAIAVAFVQQQSSHRRGTHGARSRLGHLGHAHRVLEKLSVADHMH
jgi:hypothetical protein